MTNNSSTKFTAVKLSSLPEIEKPEGFWIFGSKENEDGTLASGRYPLEHLLDYVQKIQLERRMAYTFEKASSYDIYIDEELTIYKVGMKDMARLRVTINGAETVIEPNQSLALTIPAKSVINFQATPASTSITAMYAFIYAKAKLL